MALVARSIRPVIATPSGTFDSGHLDGNDGSAAIPLAWTAALLPNLLGLTGTLSFNARLALTEPSPGVALITMRTATGDDVVTSGWTQLGDVFTNGSTAKSGTLALDATYNGQTISILLLWSRLVAVGADTLAPTIPKGVIASGTGPVSIVCEPVSDLFNPTQATSGCRRIQLKRNGAALGSPVDVPAGVLGQPTLLTFGATTGSYAQLGKQFSITANGAAGFNGTTDEGVMLAWPVSGDFTATVRITSHPATVNANAHAGLMARVTTAADSPFIQAFQGPSTSSGGRIRARLSPAVAPIAGTTVSSTAAPCDQKMTRVGDTFTIYNWTGLGWSANGTQTLAAGTVMQVGLCLASRGATQQTTVYAEISISAGPQVTFSDPAPLPGPTVNSYTLAAEDVTGNISVDSDPATITLASGVYNYKAELRFADFNPIPAGCASSTNAPTGDFHRTVVVSSVLGGPALQQFLVRHVDDDKRVELDISFNSTSRAESWFGWSMHVGTQTDFSTGQMVLMQIHHTNNPLQVTVPFAMGIINNGYFCWKQYQEDFSLPQPQVNQQPNRKMDRFNPGSALGPAFHTLVKGVREDWVVGVNWDERKSNPACAGRLRVYRNTVKIIDIVNAIGYGPYQGAAQHYSPKIGLYGFNGDPFGVGNDTVLVEHANFLFIEGTDLYNAVAPT